MSYSRRVKRVQRGARKQLAMGSNQSMPRTLRVAPRSLDDYRTLSGISEWSVKTGVSTMPTKKPLGSLGDGDSDAPLVDPQAWRDEMLANVKGVRAAQEDFTRRESLQRWFQIAATLAIPLSAAVWRAIFRSSRSDID
jgi:hypothetical protein